MNHLPCNYKNQRKFPKIDYFLKQHDNDFVSESDDNFMITNNIFDDIDFYSLESLNELITIISSSIKHNSLSHLFSNDFDYTQFYDNILNSLLSFNEELVIFSSKLLLTLSYVSNHVITYLSENINEMVAIFREFYQNQYILTLLQNIFIYFPDSVYAALEMGILDIFSDILCLQTIPKKYIKIFASIIQYITMNLDPLNQEQFDLCFEFAQNFLTNNDTEIFASGLLIISHLQKKIDFPPESIFQDDSIHILIDQLSNHQNIIPIIQVLSHFHDISFIYILFDNGFPSILEGIVRTENEPICILILRYLIDQIMANNELAIRFSFLVLVFADELDNFPIGLKINYLRFFFVCFNFNYDFIFQQDAFEFIFCSLFDLLESISQDDLNELLPMLNFYVTNKPEISDFIASHQDCYQAIYNLCSHDDETISQNSQNIISIIQEIY